jgi:hypothetical protein
LGYNRISDIVELEKLSRLDHLVNIALNNNPVSRRQLYRFTLLVQLQTVRWIDGREATWEERERAELILSKGERNPSLLYAQRIGNIVGQNNVLGGGGGGMSSGNVFAVRNQGQVVKVSFNCFYFLWRGFCVSLFCTTVTFSFVQVSTPRHAQRHLIYIH